ncbi:Fur family transcriptional regulator [Vallitaleaceae bacterium 9-2]
MENKISEIEKILQEHNYNLTKPRTKMIELFLKTSEHLCPEEIFNKLKSESISLPTVYRNIAIFKQLRIIKEININNENVYELNMFSEKRLHMHFHCKKCDQIIEYNNREIFNQMIKQQRYIEKQFGDVIENYSVVFDGICHSCYKQEEMK